MRHIDTNQLWVQDKVANKEIDVMKVPGEDNLADGLTKPMGRKGIEVHKALMEIDIRKERHMLMPEVEKPEEMIEEIGEQGERRYLVQSSQSKKVYSDTQR